LTPQGLFQACNGIALPYICENDAQENNMNINLVSRMVAGFIGAYFVRERKERK
jgi:hypothetical protein